MPCACAGHALLKHDSSRSRSPYDTLEEVIGLRGTPGHGSLREWGVAYRELPLADSGCIDWDALATAIRPGMLPKHGSNLAS